MPFVFAASHWAAAEGDPVSSWTWIFLGVGLGLAVGFMLGVSVASFHLRRQVTRKLRLIESLAGRRSP